MGVKTRISTEENDSGSNIFGKGKVEREAEALVKKIPGWKMKELVADHEKTCVKKSRALEHLDYKDPLSPNDTKIYVEYLEAKLVEEFTTSKSDSGVTGGGGGLGLPDTLKQKIEKLIEKKGI